MSPFVYVGVQFSDSILDFDSRRTVGAVKIFLGANQLSEQTVGVATRPRRRTSGATKTWIHTQLQN